MPKSEGGARVCADRIARSDITTVARRATQRETHMVRYWIAALCMALGCGVAAAQDFPTKRITIIVGVAPGGTLDALARQIAQGIQPILKQPVVVENVTGAGGLVGFQRLIKSEPDGYTLNFSNMSLADHSAPVPAGRLRAARRPGAGRQRGHRADGLRGQQRERHQGPARPDDADAPEPRQDDARHRRARHHRAPGAGAVPQPGEGRGARSCSTAARGRRWST